MADIRSIQGQGTASGTNTYAVTLNNYGPSAYIARGLYVITFTNGNTAASTLNVNSLGAKTIFKDTDVALQSGDIKAGSTHALVYDGTNFTIRVENDHRTDGIGSAVMDSNVTLTAGVSKRTFRWIGSSTATTASRTITLVPKTGENSDFTIIIEPGEVGAGFTISVVEDVNTLFLLDAGRAGRYRLDCLWDGTDYKVYVSDAQAAVGTTSQVFGQKHILNAPYGVTEQGGTQATYTLATTVPAYAILFLDEAIINTREAFASAGLATIAWRIAGDAGNYLDSVRAFDDPLYANVGAIDHCYRGGYVEFELTAGAAGSVDTVTMNGDDILGNAVTYAVSLANTALLTAEEINRGSHGYYAKRIGTSAVVRVYAPNYMDGIVGNVALATTTTTLTATTNVTNLTSNSELTTRIGGAGVAVSGKFKGVWHNDGTARAIEVVVATADLTDGYAEILIPYIIRESVV